MQKLNREAFRKLIAEDLAWLVQQRRTLERDHIELSLESLEAFHYDLPDLLKKVVNAVNSHPHLAAAGDASREVLEDALHDELCAWIEKLEGPRGG